jgi:hypothetical protein
MKKIIALALAAGVAVTSFATADAREGCGRGWHRGPYGHCRPNYDRDYAPRVVVTPGRLIIGNYYRGQGYWDGHRYWHRRYRWHDGWRYRD